MRLTLLALILCTIPARLEADPITGPTGCMDRPASPTTLSWQHPEHFQAVAFYDPLSGCEPTIYERADWLLNFEPDYDGFGGLRVTSDSIKFPTCGRLQFDLHTYLDGLLDPLGLISLVVNLGECEAMPPILPPTEVPPTEPPAPIPEPGTVLSCGIGLALMYRRYLHLGRV